MDGQFVREEGYFTDFYQSKFTFRDAMPEVKIHRPLGDVSGSIQVSQEAFDAFFNPDPEITRHLAKQAERSIERLQWETIAGINSEASPCAFTAPATATITLDEIRSAIEKFSSCEPTLVARETLEEAGVFPKSPPWGINIIESKWLGPKPERKVL